MTGALTLLAALDNRNLCGVATANRHDPSLNPVGGLTRV